jgi:hypothetical protein
MSKNPTAFEQLQARKQALQAQSEELEKRIGEHFSYLQSTWATVVGDSVLSVIVSHTPSFVQRWFQGDHLSALAGGIVDVIPFFFRGTKGLVLQFVLQQIRRFLQK